MLSNTEKLSYKSLLLNYLEDYHHINTKNQFECLNPNHSDTHPSMSYSEKYNVCHCFACGKSYDIFSLVEQDFKIPKGNFKMVINKINELYPNLISNDYQKVIKSIPKQETVTIDYSDYYIKCHNSVNITSYLTNSRGIKPEKIEKYNIGFDLEKNAIIFPINKNCYFSRGVNDNRKINSKGTLFCWGEEKLKNSRNNDFVIITESIIDAISLEQVNDKYPIISLNGVANYPRLLKAIKSNDYKGNVIIATDNDEVGAKFGTDIQKELKNIGIKIAIYYPFTHDYKDINEAYLNNPEELYNSFNYLDSVLEQIKSQQKNTNQEDSLEME